MKMMTYSRFTLAALALAFACSLPASAQRGQRNTDPAAQKERVAQRAAREAQRLKLSDETTAKFVPLYTAYLDSLDSLRRDARPEGKMKEMTDEQALQRVEQRFTMQEREVAIKRAFLEQLRPMLTAKQIFQVFNPVQMRPRPQRGQQMGGFPGGQHRMGGQGGAGFGAPEGDF